MELRLILSGGHIDMALKNALEIEAVGITAGFGDLRECEVTVLKQVAGTADALLGDIFDGRGACSAFEYSTVARGAEELHLGDPKFICMVRNIM